jgi:hypothetical protein
MEEMVMSQTAHERLALDRLREERQLQRIERANPDHFRFPRETPRKQRRIPFVADRRERVELRDAVIGAAIFAAFVGALATMPWWL